MLSKALRAINSAQRLETADNQEFAGPVRIDRRMNVTVGNSLIRGAEIRYIVLSSEEMDKVLAALKSCRVPQEDIE